MARNDDNLKSLYATLQREGYTPPEYETFVKDMENDANLQEVHNTLKQEGYTPPAFDVFKTDLLGETPAAQPQRTQFFKLRRGGKDFTVSADEVNAAGGLSEWAKSTSGDPIGVYMIGKNQSGKNERRIVPLSLAHRRSKKHGYKYETVGTPIKNKDKYEAPVQAQDAEIHGEVPQVDLSGVRNSEDFMREIDSMLPENRGRHREKEMQARIMGLDTKLPGLIAPAAAEDAAGADSTGTGEEPALNPNKPQVHDVVLDEAGNPSIEWQLNNGRLTQDRNEADVNAYESRQARLILDRRRKEQRYKDQYGDMMVAPLKDGSKTETDTSQAMPMWQYKMQEDEQLAAQQSYAASREAMESEISREREALATIQRERKTAKGDDEGALMHAERLSKDRIAKLENNIAHINGKGEGFWGMLGRQIFDVRGWDFGATDFGLYTYRSSIAEKIEKGEALTPAEEQLAEAMARDESTFENLSSMEQYGQMTGQSVTFVKDFGAAAWMKGAGVLSRVFGIGSKMTNAAARRIVSAYARNAGKNAAKMGAADAAALAKQAQASAEMSRLILKATGATIDDVVMAGAVTLGPQGMSTAAKIGNAKVGNVVKDENGNIRFENGTSLGDAIYEQGMDALIENYSEVFGVHLDGRLGIGKWAGKRLESVAKSMNPGVISNTLLRATSPAAKASMERARHIFEKLGISDFSGEVAEEYVGQGVRQAFGLESAYTTDAEGRRISNFQSPEFHKDIWFGMALSIGFMNAMKSPIVAVDYVSNRHRLKKAENVASTLLGAEVFDEVRQVVESSDNSSIVNNASNVLAKFGKNEEQKDAILNYVVRTMEMRGYNLGEGVRSSDESPESDLVGSAFSEGYDATEPEDMNDAQNMYERQLHRLEDCFSGIEKEEFEKVLNSINEDPMGAIDNVCHPDQDADVREAVIDYINAKALRDGLIQRVRDDIDEKITQSEVMVRGRVNKGSGMIHPAVIDLDERRVYVVGGNVVANEDGTIDRDASDDFLIVRDAISGKLTTTYPKAIKSVEKAINPEEELAATAEAIRQQAAQEAADKMNGTLSFNPGEVTTIINGEDEHQVTIVGPAVDKESGMPADGQVIVKYEDGTQASFMKDELQQMADAANTARLERFEQERAAANAQHAQTKEGVEDDSPEADNPYDDGVSEDAPQQSALERIPLNQDGKPDFAAVEPDLAWDGIVEKTGDERIAQAFVDNMIAASEKKLKQAEKVKAQESEDIDEFMASENARLKAIDDAKAVHEHWKKVAGTKQLRETERRNAEEAEARRHAQERAEEEARQKAEREEAARIEREALNGVPDWAADTPADARARSYRRVGSEKVDRPAVINNNATGNAVEVRFGDKVMPKAHIVVIEASQLQPSHRDGHRNPSHFLDEAQPKERKDAASRFAAAKIAEEIRPEEITSSVTAFTGAPSVNARGEVIQGNNRSEALRIMYERNAQSAAKYKQYLSDHAAEFGLTPDAIASFEQPVLVNMLDVSDAEAITLGQYVAQDTESGGVERIKPRNAVQKMGENAGMFADILLRSADDEATFSQLVDANGVEALKWLNRQGIITDTQYASAFDSRGNLTAEAANDLKGIMYQSIFTGGSTRLEEMFNNLPAKAQRALLATAFRDHNSIYGDRMIGEIQQSIIAYNALMSYEQFRDATSADAIMNAVESWKKQTAFDDVSGETYLPSETFSNFALMLAFMYKGRTQKHIQSVFNAMYDIVQGTEEDNLFETADKTPKPLAEAIHRVLDIEYKPVAKKTNGTDGGAVLDSDSENGQGGRSGSDGNTDSPEQRQNEAESTDSGAGAADDSRGGGNLRVGGKGETAAQEERLIKEEASGIIAEMEEKAIVAPEIELTIENWDAQFGEDGIVSTPIGNVKMGENQFTKLMRQGRNGKLGMIKPTLETPDIIIEDASEAKDAAATERESSYVFVKTFVKPDGSRYYYFTSVTVSKDGHEVVISNQEKRRNVLTNLLMKGKLVWKHADDVSSTSDVADGLFSPQGDMSDPVSEGTDAPQTNDSDRKVNTLSSDKQADSGKSSAKHGGKGYEIIEDREGYSIEVRHTKDGDSYAVRLKKSSKPSEWKKDVGEYGVWSSDGRGEILFDSFEAMTKYLESRGEDVSALSEKAKWIERDKEVNDRLYAETGLREGQIWTGPDGTRVVIGARGYVKGPDGWDFSTSVTYPDGRKESTLTPALRIVDFFKKNGYKHGTDKPESLDHENNESQSGTARPVVREKIEDFGEKIAGARKDMLKDVAKSVENVTVQSLIELPISKAFKKPPLKKLVDSGIISDSDAVLAEAVMQGLIYAKKKPALTRKPSSKREITAWAEETYNGIKLLGEILSGDENRKSAAMAGRRDELALKLKAANEHIAKMREWNPGHKFADLESIPDAVEVIQRILEGTGYHAGDKVELPLTRVELSSDGSHFMVSAPGKQGAYWFSRYFRSLDDAVDTMILAAKLSRGDMDVELPQRQYNTRGVGQPHLELTGKYVVGYMSKNGLDYKEAIFDSEEKAAAFAKEKNGKVSPQKRYTHEYDKYVTVVTNPLTGNSHPIGEEYDTRAEAVAWRDENAEALNAAALEAIYKETGAKGTSRPHFYIGSTYSRRRGKMIFSVIADDKSNPWPIVKDFESRQEAESWLADNIVRLEAERKANREAERAVVYFDNAGERHGDDYRGGKDATPEMFTDAFGFRGVQFGNWTNDADRQAALNQAYDALMDMAHILGLKPRSLSLDGELGLAFGARGNGQAAAHYEPTEVVINLTKTQGAGSLAHEWWHAVDNFLSRRAGVPTGYASSRNGIDAMNRAVAAAIDEMMADVEKSEYFRRSKNKGAYWGSPTEVMARLFASWIAWRLTGKDRRSPFLASELNPKVLKRYQSINYLLYRANERMKAAREQREPNIMTAEEFYATPDSLVGYPYPTDAELIGFAPRIENLFSTLAERESESGSIAKERGRRYAKSQMTGMSLFDWADKAEREQRQMSNPNEEALAAEEANTALCDYSAAYREYVEQSVRLEKAIVEAGAKDEEAEALREHLAAAEEQILDARERLKEKLREYYIRENTPSDAERIARDMTARAEAEVDISLRKEQYLRDVLERGEDPVKNSTSVNSTAMEVKTAGGYISYNAEGHLPDTKVGEFAYMERQFSRSGEFQFTGDEYIKDRGDVAYMFRALEDYSIEHVFAVLVRDGRAKILHLGMGGPTASYANLNAIRAGYDAFGADKIYLVHNHPSGTLTASTPDMRLMKRLEEAFGRIAETEGIIIDTTSGRYSVFNSNGVEERATRPMEGGNAEAEIIRFDRVERHEDQHASVVIGNSEDVARFVSGQRLGSLEKVSYIVLTNGNEIVGNFHTDRTRIDESGFAEELASVATKFGGTSVIVYGNTKISGAAELGREVAKYSLDGVRLLDALEVTNGTRFSAVDLGMLRESGAEYGVDGAEVRVTRPKKSTPDRIEEAFDAAVSGDLKGKPLEVGKLTQGGRALLEKLSGVKMKENVSFVLNPSDLVHIYRRHYGKNEKDGRNIPLTKEDVRQISEIVSSPDRIVFGKETSGNQRNMFFFLKEANDGSYNLMEVYSDKKGNLTAKSFFKSKEGVSQRAMLLNESSTLTSVTDGATLSDGAKLPKFFEYPTSGSEDLLRTGIPANDNMPARDTYERMVGKDRERFSKERQAENAMRERQRMASRIRELAERMHLDNVEIVTDASQLEGKRARAKGYYNRRTGKITIVIPNNLSTIDAEQTLLHEAVAHFGLRKLFGEQFNTFLDNVYESADKEIRRKIVAMAAENGWDFRTATEEYLAGLAENMNFEEAQRHRGWWLKIKDLFLSMVEKIGFRGFRDNNGIVLGDNELRYILWRSYKNLTEPGGTRGIMAEATDVVKQSELKVGNYAERGIEAEYAVEPISDINDNFNNQIDRWTNGEMKSSEYVNAGTPQGVMRAFMPSVPIIIRQKVLTKSKKKHALSADQIKDLPGALANPIFVFKKGNNTVSVLTELQDGNGQNLFVSIEIGVDKQLGHEFLEVNDILTIHGREAENIVLPILDNNTLKWVDKTKGLNWLSSAKTNSQAITKETLSSAAKVVKTFENPTIEEEDLFRPGDFAPRDKVLARDTYERMVSKGSFQFQEAMQDSMLGLKKLYEAILGKEGRHIEEVGGYENAYLYENRMSSANNGQQHEYFIRYMQPLLKEIGRIAGADESKRQELTDYMMAKHGLERNAHMRAEAEKKGEDADRDFAGLVGLTGEADWRSAEATAQQWVDDYESTVDTTELWKAVNNATKATLEKVYLSGIISKSTYEEIRDMYEYYIPLRGWDEKTSEQVYGYLTSKDGPLGGSIMKKAGGRESKADDPIATIAMMADAAISQGNRNLMKQRFLTFVLNHPSDVVSVHDVWLEYDDVTGEWRPVFADVEPGDSAEEVEQKIEAFEQRMEALKKASPDKYKRGREADDIPYKVVKGRLREHQVLIKRNGRTYVATINGNPRAAQALNGLTNPDVEQNGAVGNLLRAGTWINRQLSAFYTTRNPDFVVSNFVRDMVYSNCMTWVKESPRYALRFHKNFGMLNPAIMRKLLGKWEKGSLDRTDEYENLFYEFMMNGGETGYTSVRDIDGHKRAVSAELKKQGNSGRKAWAWLGMQMDLLNRSVENCARFAAYVTSRECGRSIDRSVYDAKEVSVNFNKKGSGGKMIGTKGMDRNYFALLFNPKTYFNKNDRSELWGQTGAHLGGIGRVAFVFWNAGLQGMTNFGRQAVRHPAKFVAEAATLYAMGYMIPLLAQATGGGDGDDDDRNAYYNLPEYIRRSNICFRAGEQWVTIPLPIEYRAMYGLGELCYGVISGNERYGNEELSRQLAAQVSQILPLDMLEGGGGHAFIPSAFKPFTEAYIMNEGWTGLPVYKDTPYNKNEPDWTKAYASTDSHLVDFARWASKTSGGNDYKKGDVDINPAQLEYLLNGTFGGMMTFPNKIKKMVETGYGARDFEWRNVPIVNRLIKSGDERTAFRKLRNEYYRYMEEYKETGRLMRSYRKAADEGIMGYAEEVNFLENSPEALRYEITDMFRGDIEAYYDRISEEKDKAKKTELEAEMYGVMREHVDAMHDPVEFFRGLYEDGRLGEESVRYLEKHHGIKLEKKSR